MKDTYLQAWRELVLNKIAAEVIDQRVITAFLKVKRHLFVPSQSIPFAYTDRPIDIGGGQTTSQPSLIAKMVELLELSGTESVLEVGTGSGYQTAILAQLAKKVYSVERIAKLAKQARKNLRLAGVKNAELSLGDGSLGLPDKAPFDRIIVSAAARAIPPALIDQLAPNGMIVIPLLRNFREMLMRGEKIGTDIQLIEVEEVRFVPLV